MFGVCCAAIQEIGQIIAVGVFEVADADSDQAEARGSDFMREQVAACGKDAGRELRRGTESARPRADLEVGTFEFQRHGRTGECVGLQAG